MLNSVEILVLGYADGVSVELGLTQSFWKYQYSVDVDKVVGKLIRGNYLSVEQDLKSALRNKTVKELKELLDEYSLTKNGKKAELIDRIVSSEFADVVASKYSSDVFMVTEKGRNILQDNEYVLEVHRYADIEELTMYRAQNIKKAHPEYSAKDVLDRMFNEITENALRNQEYDRLAYYDEARVRYLRKKLSNMEALHFSLRAFLFTASGCEHFFHDKSLGFSEISMISSSTLTYFFQCYDRIIKEIQELLLANSLSKEEVINIMKYEIMPVVTIPNEIRIFTNTDVLYLLDNSLSQNYAEVEQFVEQGTNHLRADYKGSVFSNVKYNTPKKKKSILSNLLVGDDKGIFGRLFKK